MRGTVGFFSPSIMGYVTVTSDKDSTFPYYSIPSHCELVVMKCRVEEAMKRTENQRSNMKPKESPGHRATTIAVHLYFFFSSPCERPCSASASAPS